MDRQNSWGHKEHSCNTKATLQYATALKAHIQNQVFELTAALKKVEHELCMQIDQQCRSKLQGLEYLCENDKCVPGCQNLKTQFDDDDSFPKKQNLDWDFKVAMRLFQNYGQTRKYDLSKIMTRVSEAFKDTSEKEQVKSRENVNPDGDSEDCFEFVDSVECLRDELHSEIRNVLKQRGELVDNSEEALERASCSSVDSFDVIPNECCMNDSVCLHAQPLPAIVRLPNLPETNRHKKRHSGFLFSRMLRRSPRSEDRERLPSKGAAEGTEQKMCVDIVSSSKGVLGGVFATSKTNTSPAQETSASVSTTTEVMDDIEIISSSEEIAQQEMAMDATEEESAVFPDENNPANALQDSFKLFLQKQDMKAWVHPNSEPRANNYEDWVFRVAAPRDPNPLTPNGSVSTEPACSSEAVSAFFRQLRAFVV